MVAVRKVRIRRINDRPSGAVHAPLLDSDAIDDLVDAFGLDDAEVQRVDVVVDEQRAAESPASGIVAASATAEGDDAIEELTEGIEEGWVEDDEDAA